MYIYFKLGYNFSSCCYNVFSIDFPIPFPSSPWRISYIIQLPLDNLGSQFVDHQGHYLSACPIKNLPKPVVSCDSQGNTVQKFSSHKCNQEVWQDALNVVAATIPSVMSWLTPSPKLFLYSMSSSSNVPLTWPYYPRV